MKVLSLGCLLASAAILTGGCVSTPDYQLITTEAEYRTAVVGRSVKLGSGFSKTHEDGTMTGTTQGKEINGTWTWEDGMFCREGMIGSDPLERDCQKMEIAGDRLRVTRNAGTGAVTEFDLE